MGRVHVADRGNPRIQRFDGTGRLLDVWQGESLGRPWALAVAAGDVYWGHAIAVAPDGAVFVGDVRCGMRVQKFTR